jgi:hypothetical protein
VSIAHDILTQDVHVSHAHAKRSSTRVGFEQTKTITFPFPMNSIHLKHCNGYLIVQVVY